MTDLLTPIRSEHTCPDCSGSFMPVSHMPATTAAEAADREAAGGSPMGVPVVTTSAAADLAALRSLLWYRGDLAGELAP